ncbi:DoxX family protein [Dactylosporangium sp. NPDC000521]|uniref:DoxX family protein n=1 Tax=Dactylosporangium sp. NPDC000521 TaxID=3363975 RepID=UPI0036CD836C
MLAAIFVIQGWAALRAPAKLADTARPVTDRLEPALKAVHPSLPTDAETLVRVNGAAQVAGGILLATGRATTPAALVLAGSLVPTTLAGHAFWEVEDPVQRNQQRINFLKNLGLVGGLLFAALDNEGRPSIAWRARSTAARARREASHTAQTAKREAGHAARAARREARHAVHTAQREAKHVVNSAQRDARIARLARKLP